MNALDFRPRVVFHTTSGAVVVVIDPATALGGSVLLPGLGAVPYDLDLSTASMILHVPSYGTVVIPLLEGGGDGTITIPGMGTVPYDIVIGEPDIPYEQRVTIPSAFFLGTGLASILPLVAIGVLGWFLLRRR